ncbi:MAG: PorT family protein [Chlorobi bacterium]|nr:PorT family protein [Chlorobiota bacterium]
MKNLFYVIILLSVSFSTIAQVTDSTAVSESDTIVKPKDKTLKVMFGDKELINVDINKDDFDMNDFEENSNGDTTKIRIGKKNIIIIDGDDKTQITTDETMDNEDSEEDNDNYKAKKFKGHWGGIELGLNNFLNNNNELSLPSDGQFMDLNTSKSIEFDLNFAEKSFPIYKNRLGIVTGMGLRFNNYHFDNNIMLNPNSVYQTTVVDTNFDKNKLSVTYLTVPLLLEYHIPVGKKHKPIYFSTGIIGGLKIGSKTKQKYTINGDKNDDKSKQDFGISPFTYGLTARAGYKNINLFANYTITSFFEKNKGPELYPLTIGISLMN